MADFVFRTLVADDGAIYALTERSDDNFHLKKLLPFNKDPIIKVPKNGENSLDWVNGPAYSEENGTIIPPVQIARGHVYHLTESSGSHDIVITKISDKSQKSLLASSGKYEIFNWRLRGTELHFAAKDLAKNTIVKGTIDALKVNKGEDQSSYLKLQEMFSTENADTVVNDITGLLPVKPEADPGGEPVVQTFHFDENGSFAVSFDFSKYMDQKSVEEGIEIKDASGNELPLLFIWVYKTLHAIIDSDGLTNDTTPTLPYNTTYTVSFGSGVKDAYGWDLGGTKSWSITTGQDPNYVAPPPDPDDGFSLVSETGRSSSSALASDDDVAKFWGPTSSNTLGDAYELHTGLSYPLKYMPYHQGDWLGTNFDFDYFSVSYSVKSLSTSGSKDFGSLILWNQTKYANGSGSFKGNKAIEYLFNASDSATQVRYQQTADTWADTAKTASSSIPDWLQTEEWVRFRIDFIGTTVKVFVAKDNSSFARNQYVEITELKVDSDLRDLSSTSDDLSFMFLFKKPCLIDKLAVSRLNGAGNLWAGEEGDEGDSFHDSIGGKLTVFFDGPAAASGDLTDPLATVSE